MQESFNMCKSAILHVSYFVLLCTLHLSERRSENLNSIVHVRVTKEVQRTVAYSNEQHVSFLFYFIKQHWSATERTNAAFSLSLSLSLHLVVWRPLQGWTSERRLLKKQVVWVLAHSLPVVLPEGLPWKQGVWQAPGGSATAAGTSFLTAWWRHHCHNAMHSNNNNNNYWRKNVIRQC